MYTVYFTIYLGQRLPPFYIGSTHICKIDRGYHGSVSSAKYGKVWKQELKENPQLFVTFVIPGEIAPTATEILELELAWQREFDVVDDPRFINQCFAKGGFCSTSESAKKAVATRIKNGKCNSTDETKAKISNANRGRKYPKSKEYRETMRQVMLGRVFTDQWCARISAANIGKKHSEETKQKMREAARGRKSSPESIAKRLQTLAINGGYSHSEETKAKIGNANRGRTLSPQTEETRAKKSATLKGRPRSPDAIKKMNDTLARKRAEKINAGINTGIYN